MDETTSTPINPAMELMFGVPFYSQV